MLAEKLRSSSLARNVPVKKAASFTRARIYVCTSRARARVGPIKSDGLSSRAHDASERKREREGCYAAGSRNTRTQGRKRERESELGLVSELLSALCTYAFALLRSLARSLLVYIFILRRERKSERERERENGCRHYFVRSLGSTVSSSFFSLRVFREIPMGIRVWELSRLFPEHCTRGFTYTDSRK